MSFEKNERTLEAIQSEMKKLKKNMNKSLNKRELKKNVYLRDVNENIIKNQRKIYETYMKQLEQIEKLYDYLENNYENNKEMVSFQQGKLDELRKKIEKEIKKYN